MSRIALDFISEAAFFVGSVKNHESFPFLLTLSILCCRIAKVNFFKAVPRCRQDS